MNRYITLTTSDESFSKKFKVLWSGYGTPMSKKQTEETTLNGQYDISQGGVYERREYPIKTREEELDPEYGVYDDLKTLFKYNNPAPVSGPSNKFTLTDHYGQQYLVMFAPSFIPQPLSVVLEGPYAFYITNVTFIILSEVGS